MTLKEYHERMKQGKRKGGKKAPQRRSPFAPAHSPNKTEQRYQTEVLGGAGLYEGVSLKLPGGSRYTPDWVTWDASGRMTCHEVKGAFRFASESRAVCAARECAAHFPQITFVWATYTKDKQWEIFRTNEVNQ